MKVAIIKYMIKMNYFFLLMSILLISCNKKISSDTLANPKVTYTSDTFSFPDDWLGYWEGELNIYNENGKTTSLPMALDHHKTDNDSIWTWAIIYGKDTITGRRDYELNMIDASKGHFMIDEKNSIYIDAFLLNRSLISTFNVSNNHLQTEYTLEGDEMIFRIHMHPDTKFRSSGDSVIEGVEIPIVHSFKNTVLQEARLTKR